MFAYCFNNPVNKLDPNGDWPKLSTIFAVATICAVAVVAVAAVVVTCGAAAPVMVAAGGGVVGGLAAGSPGGEFHVEWGTTNTLPKTKFNIYDIARYVYIKIMEW